MTFNPKQLMQQHQLDPRKGLGQNFLQDPNTLRKIVETAEIQDGETLVEIGPGTGALTRQLAEMHPHAHIVCIEIDQRLQPILAHTLADLPNVRVIWGDILEVNLQAELGGVPFKVVANVPYYISSAILKHVLQDTTPRPTAVIMTVQYELAERICQTPPDMSLLAVSVQFYGAAQLAFKIGSSVFWPRPDVDSAVLHVQTYPQPIIDVPSDALFFRVVKAGFSQKRKQLRNALAGGLGVKAAIAGEILARAAIDPARRAETLTLEEWGTLTRAYAAHNAQA